MGAMSGTVEGKSKLATWKAYLAEVGRLVDPEEQDRRGMFVQFPTNKKDAYQRMTPVGGGGWTLYYRFHT